MEISITSENKKDYLLIQSKGSVETKDDLFEHSQILYDEIIKHGLKKIVINEPETHFPLDLFHYFGLVKNYIDNFPPQLRDLKVAIVISKEYKEVAASWEALCVGRGFQFFAFTSFQDAVKCVLSENSA